MSDSDRGLYGKFEVFRGGEPVDGCFVLRPGSDPAAAAAIETYIQLTTNEALADDLREWLWEIGANRTVGPPRGKIR